MNKIYLKANLAVSGGPAISIQSVMDAEVCASLNFTVPAGSSDTKVELQPGAAMSLMFLTADWLGKELSFRVAKTAEAAVIKLDQPLLLAGGALAALGKDQPQVLYFSNSANKGAHITGLVARRAIPAP